MSKNSNINNDNLDKKEENLNESGRFDGCLSCETLCCLLQCFIMKHVRAWKKHLKQHKTLEILRLVNYSWHHKKPDLLQPRINYEHSK